MGLIQFVKFLITSLACCTSVSFASELNVWCWDQNFNVKALDEASNIYQKKHKDFSINILNDTENNVMLKFQSLLASNRIDQLPDIILIEDYKAHKFFDYFPNFFTDISKNIDLSKFADYKVKVSTEQDKQYGVPFDSGIVGTFIRADLFENAGIPLNDLEDLTWDKFIEYGKQLKAKTGYSLFAINKADSGLLKIILHSSGSWYFDNNEKLFIINNESLKEAFKVIKKLDQNNLIEYSENWTDYLLAFQQNKVAVILSGCWIIPSIEVIQSQKGNWRLVKLPKLDDIPTATHYSNIGGSQWYVNNYSKKKELAIDFLKETFASNEELVNDLALDISLISVLKDTSRITNYDIPNNFFGGQKIYKALVSWTNKIPPVKYGVFDEEVEQELHFALDRYLEGEDLDIVLQDADTLIRQQIDIE